MGARVFQEGEWNKLGEDGWRPGRKRSKETRTLKGRQASKGFDVAVTGIAWEATDRHWPRAEQTNREIVLAEAVKRNS